MFIVGTRGKPFEFNYLFSHSSDAEVIGEIAKHDTPDNRRSLYTLLRALEEIPKSWARSALVRFLRGQGEQAKPKYAYTGKGMFGKEYGWKEDEIIRVCDLLMGGRYNAYSDMLITFADVQSEIRKDDENLENRGSYAATFAAVRTERNKKLIGSICSILEARGLGEIPSPEIQAPKEARIPKQFKTGDKIRKDTLRDLPLPALVKVPVEKNTDGDRFKGKWELGEVEWVVTHLYDNGYALCFRVGPVKTNPQDRVAYASSSYRDAEPKDFLYGAEYLGPWVGESKPGRPTEYDITIKLPK